MRCRASLNPKPRLSLSNVGRSLWGQQLTFTSPVDTTLYHLELYVLELFEQQCAADSRAQRDTLPMRL